MAIPFLNNISLNNNEIQNVRLQNTANIISPGNGQIYFDTDDNMAKYWNGESWVNITDYYLTGLSFNKNDGILTASVSNNNTALTLSTPLDGRYLTENETITLTGEVTGSGTTTILTTVANGVLDVANFNVDAIVTAGEGIENNDNDTTLPTSAAVKAYIDASAVGGLVYQGGYDAATNTPDLDSTPIAGIKKGWTYTVTVDGLFFTEQVRVGDVIIAEIDSPTTLADWTTVQNNIDIASASQIGIGNVAAGSGVDVSYANGTATVSIAASAARSGSIAVPNSATYTYPDSIEASSTNNVLIQLVDSNGETVYADVQRLSTTTFSVNYGVTTPTGVIALIQLIG
jgi:hypothetical protein